MLPLHSNPFQKMKSNLYKIDTVLLGSRTVARRFRENDGPVFFDLLQDNSSLLADHFSHMLSEVGDPETAEAFVRKSIADWLMQNAYVFGIWEHQSAKLIGLVTITDIDWQVPKGELSYFLDRGFTGKGIMTETLLGIVKFAFEQLQMEKLYIRTAMDNYAAQRLARKCGFRREGDLRADLRKVTGEPVDIMLLGLTRAE